MAFPRAVFALATALATSSAVSSAVAQDSSQFGVPLWLGEQGAEDRRLHMELDAAYENVKFCPASFVTNTAPFVTTNFCTTTTTTTFTTTLTTTTRTTSTSTLTTKTTTSTTLSTTTSTLTTTSKTTSTSTTSTRTTSTSSTTTLTTTTTTTGTTTTTTVTTTTTSSTTVTTSTSTMTVTTTTTSTSTLTTSTSTKSTTTTPQSSTVTTSTSTITTTTTLTTTTTTSSTRTTSTSSTTTTTTKTATSTTRTTTTTTHTTTTVSTSTSTNTYTTTTTYTNTTTTSTGTTTTLTTTTTSSTTTTTTTTPYFCPLCQLYPTQNCHQIEGGKTCTAIPMETECVEQPAGTAFAELQCSSGNSLQVPPTLVGGDYPKVMCKVCGTPTITADTDNKALSYTGTLKFGPNMKANFVNESLIKSYVLQWTFGNGRPSFGNISEIPKLNASDPSDGCCDETKYTFDLNSVPIMGTHIMISPIAYGVPGGNVAEFLLPDGVEVSVIDNATECPPLISYLRPIDEDLVMQACTTQVNTTTSTVTTRTATSTTASSTTTSTVTGTKTTSTSSTTTGTTTTRTTSTSTTSTTITATTDTTTATTETTTATTVTTTTTSTTKTSSTSTYSTSTVTTTTKTTSTSTTLTTTTVTTTTKTTSTSTTSTVTTTTTTTITTTTTTTSTSSTTTTATTSTSTQTTTTSTVSTSTVTTLTITTSTTSTLTSSTSTSTTKTTTSTTVTTTITTTTTKTTKTLTTTTITTTSTTITPTTTTKTTTIVPCKTCSAGISLWEGCTDNTINPSQTCEQVTSETTFNVSDPYWKDKFRVVQSDCVAYEGGLDQYCPAGNDQMDRAPVWRTYNSLPNYNGYIPNYIGNYPYGSSTPNRGHPGYPGYSHDGDRQDEPWYAMQQALPQVVCQVCALVGAEDTDQLEGAVTMTVYWGQNAIGNEIDQQPVMSYQLYWTNDALELTDPNGSAIIDVQKPNPEQFDQKTHCGCNDREYMANLEAVPFPVGTTKLMVVPVDVNGFAMPVGKAFDVVDVFTTTTTTATTVTVTPNRPGGDGDGSGTTAAPSPTATLPKNAQAGAEQTRLSAALLLFTAMAFLLAC